jgi:hypothetical protein
MVAAHAENTHEIEARREGSSVAALPVMQLQPATSAEALQLRLRRAAANHFSHAKSPFMPHLHLRNGP